MLKKIEDNYVNSSYSVIKWKTMLNKFLQNEKLEYV